jgi:hypothetical protein
MSEESNITFPAFVYSALREMNNNSPEVTPEELAKRAYQFVPAMLVATGVLRSVEQNQLEDILLRTFQSFRNKPAGLNGGGVIFDSSWLDRINRSDWKYWPNLSKFLGEYLLPSPRSPESIGMLDICSDDVLRWAGPPDCIGLRKGLVLGYVQSGKTQNFTALISKAADCGYKLIIVLSGIDNELRKQTQMRIRRDILGAKPVFTEFGVPIPQPRWEYFTDEENDFRKPSTSATEILTNSSPCCLVVKKHAGVLQKVIDWLEPAAENLKESPPPTLIIDDEADQASPNAAHHDYDPTKINGRIRSIIKLFESRCRYVAYTATPFANFFINSEAESGEFGKDLFPEHFLRALPLPVGYVGTADIYGLPAGILRNGKEVRPAGICRTVEDQPDDFGRMHAQNIPAGLYQAVLAFYIGTAVTILQRGNDEPSTMLVHVSHLNDDQEDNHTTVHACMSDLQSRVMSVTSSGLLRAEFENLYLGDFVLNSGLRSASSTDLPEFPVVWKEIERLLNEGAIEVRVVNGKNDSAPDFESPDSADRDFKGILVGGNLLSRGLTLKNLLVSYFLRRSTQADTMLQMARWLGYRRDYLHLMRIYTTLDLQRDMEEIAGAEQDVRNQIEQMEVEGKTPREFSVRVRIRQGLLPTARNKMFNATAAAGRQSFASARVETREFPESVECFDGLNTRNAHNQVVVRKYISNLQPLLIPDSAWRKYTMDGQTALRFIDELMFDKDEPSLGSENVPGKQDLLSYITLRQVDSELIDWEIILCGLQSSRIGAVEVIPGVVTYPIERGREFYGSNLTSRISNLGEGKDEYMAASSEERRIAEGKTPKPVSKSDGKIYRTLRNPKVGRIFIYPISVFSNDEMNGGSGRGKKLFSDRSTAGKVGGGFLLAFGISFPDSVRALSGQTEYFNRTVS